MDTTSGLRLNGPVHPGPALLRRALRVLDARVLRLTGRDASPPELIVDSPRLLLVERTSLDYVVEGRRFTVRPGTLLLVPALVRRRWTKRGATTVSYVVFETDPPLSLAPVPYLARSANPARDAEAFARIAELVGSRGAELELEGETKALLGRFLPRARRVDGWPMAASADAALTEALRWVETHYARPDAVAGLHERSRLSEWHFRRLFRRLVGTSPSGYVTQLRLRVARSRLRNEALSVKEVAAAVGYADPLYFSRVYRRHWGEAPSHARRRSSE